LNVTLMADHPTALAALERGPLAARRKAVERYLDGITPYFEEQTLDSAIAYSLLSPGKRLRPLLVLTACEAVSGEWRRALPAAAAVECVHAFSLVHDDLPAMDNDDYRRGRLTTHKQYGEALAVLAGDALLALAFEELGALERRGVPARRVLRTIQVLARASGREQLIAGQALDIAAEGQPVDGGVVLEIHKRKTGALISASLQIGAIVGGARPDKEQRLEFAGRELGLAFQIHDDLLNRASSLEQLGKQSGTDAARGKATYPGAVGEEPAADLAATYIRRTLSRVHSLGPRAAHLVRLIEAMAERDH
jgi:geranylgeranyl diphosphate synthase type II